MSEQLTTEKGIELFKQGKYQEAVELFKQSIAQNPSDVRARNHLAVSYSQMGKTMEAINEYAALIQIDSTNPQYYYNLGIVYEKLPDMLKAEESYVKALELNPDYVKAKERLGIIKKVQNPPSPPTPQIQQQSPPQQSYQAVGDVPYEVKSEWNWGAFLLTWIWGIGNGVWIALLYGLIQVLGIIMIISLDTRLEIAIIFGLSPVYAIYPLLLGAGEGLVILLALILVLGLAVQIYLLIKGNQLAWKSMKYDSVEDFFKVQDIWLIVGLVIIPTNILIYFLVLLVVSIIHTTF